MRVTNSRGLPEPFAELAARGYECAENEYRVTELLKPTREILLVRRHQDEIVEDVADRVWALFGTTAHAALENSEVKEGQLREARLKRQFGEFTVSGQFDLYENETVKDYKTCSVWKFKMGDFADWKKQLMIYSLMLFREGYKVKRAEIIAFLRDHRKGEARRDSEYPREIEVIGWDVDTMELARAQEIVTAKLKEISDNLKTPDKELPECTDAERWARDAGWAVMKKGKNKALRVLPDYDRALAWKGENGGDYIEERKGRSAKCEDYCAAAPWCSQYQKMKENEE